MAQAAAGERAGSADAPRYARHRPEQTLLYRIVAQHYPAFVELLGWRTSAWSGNRTTTGRCYGP